MQVNYSIEVTVEADSESDATNLLYAALNSRDYIKSYDIIDSEVVEEDEPEE